MLFLVVVNVMERMIGGKKKGIGWELTEQLKDLDFADKICFLSHLYHSIKSKLDDLEVEGRRFGLKMNSKKTKSLYINTKKDQIFRISGRNIEEVNSFTYLVV